MGKRRRPRAVSPSGGRVLLAALVVAMLLGFVQGGGDPYRPQQWHLDHIGAPQAWERSTGSGVVIAIVDSGVDLAHPDLVDRFYRDADANIVGYDFVDDDTQPQDKNGHGTMVAGIAAAATENGIGVAAVAPQASIMPIRVLDAEGAGNGRDVDAGIRWAVDNGADVINLSLESVVPVPGSVVSQAPTEAVRYAWDRGVVVVAATGNSSSPFTDYPSSSPVLLVGAVDRNDEPAAFSDSGRRDAIMAPGVDIVSTWCDTSGGTGSCDERPDRKYGKGDGTSFAAPQVAAVIALLRGAGFGHEQAVERVRATAVDLAAEGPDATTGVGRIDAAAAVPETPPPPRPTPDDPGTPRPDTAPADEQTPAPAPSPPPSPSPAPTASPQASPSVPAPTATPTETVTVPAPGTQIEGLDSTPTSSEERVLRWLAAALVVATGSLVFVVRRQLLPQQEG